ncbi:MAG: hypothetical protein M3N38_07800 [Pseudomonadota bacterium]|nr:hypothetical protein [Pseudomonadota bacterium]
MKASWANGMVLAFAAVLAITMHAARLTAAEMTEAEIKALTHGTFVLESWDLDGQPVRPPAADGRLSLHNNVVMLMARSQSGDKLHAVYGFGRYQLTGATWSYEYLNSTELKATGSRAEAGYELPWRGMRKFKLRTEAGKVIGENHDGAHHQIIFEPAGLAYLEDGRLVRNWKRVPD